jgi:serine/threonine-protein kinase RsbW
MDLNEVFLEQRRSHSHGEIEEMNATFEVRTVSDHLSVLFSSALEKIDAVSRETEKFLSHLGIQEKAFRILLSMREALANAILHGNQGNPQKLVQYRVHVEEGDVVMEVKDEGTGFDWKRHMKRKPRANAESGRGLFIMQQFASDVRFNDRGSHLVLRFK